MGERGREEGGTVEQESQRVRRAEEGEVKIEREKERDRLAGRARKERLMRTKQKKILMVGKS